MKVQFLPWRQTYMYGSWDFECLIKPALVIHSDMKGLKLQFLFIVEI